MDDPWQSAVGRFLLTKERSKMFERVFYSIYGLFSGKLNSDLAGEQYTQNVLFWENYKQEQTKGRKKKDTRYLENQHRFGGMVYGKANRLEQRLFFKGKALTAADNCCEVIAVYNVLQSLEEDREDADFPELLRAFSGKGIAAKGVFGTTPQAMIAFMKERGYETAVLKATGITRAACDRVEEEYAAFFYVCFNEKNRPWKMIHTMAVTKENHAFVLHNDLEGSRVADHLYDLICGYNKGINGPIVLVAVRR
mgnify:CR=1 FL=1